MRFNLFLLGECMRFGRRFVYGTMLAIILMTQTVIAAAPAKDVYKAKCAMCHGADGRGYTAGGKALHSGNFQDPGVRKMTDPELTLIITNGIRRMPAFKTRLTKEDIQGLVAYIHVLQER